MKEIRKITAGFVVQRWNARTEQFLGQEFVPSGQVSYEDEYGNPIEDDEPEYRPFEMVQAPVNQ
jgi:hypothetical protein